MEVLSAFLSGLALDFAIGHGVLPPILALSLVKLQPAGSAKLDVEWVIALVFLVEVASAGARYQQRHVKQQATSDSCTAVRSEFMAAVVRAEAAFFDSNADSDPAFALSNQEPAASTQNPPAATPITYILTQARRGRDS